MSNWTSANLAGLRVVGDTSRSSRPVDARKTQGVSTDGKGIPTRYSERQTPANGREASERVQRFEVPAIAPSINQLYTMHHQKRGKVARQFKNLVSVLAREQGLQPVERYPVAVLVVCHFGPGHRQYDAENLALSAKFAGDGLRAAGILENDSPAYVSSVTLEPRRTERESYTEYIITEGL